MIGGPACPTPSASAGSEALLVLCFRMGVLHSIVGCSDLATCRSVAAQAATVDRLEDLKVRDPQCSRGFTYTSFEANAWQAKFAKSGTV